MRPSRSWQVAVYTQQKQSLVVEPIILIVERGKIVRPVRIHILTWSIHATSHVDMTDMQKFTRFLSRSYCEGHCTKVHKSRARPKVRRTPCAQKLTSFPSRRKLKHKSSQTLVSHNYTLQSQKPRTTEQKFEGHNVAQKKLTSFLSSLTTHCRARGPEERNRSSNARWSRIETIGNIYSSCWTWVAVKNPILCIPHSTYQRTIPQLLTGKLTW